MLTVGVVFGFIIFILTSSSAALEHAVSSIGYGGYIYLSFLLVALVLLRTKEKEQKEMLDKTRMFGGAIAHEVRSPIASMMMSLDAVNDVLLNSVKDAKDDNEQDDYTFKMTKTDYDYLHSNIKTLTKTGARAIGTVNHILTSLNTNVITDGAKPLSIKKIVEDAIALYLQCEVHHTYTANKIEVNVSKDFMVVCGENYMHHMIMNLIKNAYHHGGADVTVKIWNDGSTLYLEDNGKGIPKSKLSRIFDSFASTSSTGTGIGLSFCKTVVESFGGTIECESEVGKYTRFIMRFLK